MTQSPHKISDDELEKLAFAECNKRRDECGLIDTTYAEMFIAGHRAAERNYEQALITKTPDCVTKLEWPEFEPREVMSAWYKSELKMKTNEEMAREVATNASMDDEMLMHQILVLLDAKDAVADQLVAALEFYAQWETWQHGMMTPACKENRCLCQDTDGEGTVPGKRARTALAAHRGKV